ncbi:MAG: IPT/TIG domain-containing protein [Bacteroidia bacterium]|nr:IPT/TIG domain-containing protein [Bacteroidia bacterium]
MRRIRYFLLLFFCPCFLVAQGTWTQKSSIGNSDWTERVLASGFEINGTGYVACGQTSGRQNFRMSARDVYAYNPISGVWSRVADCGNTGRIAGIAFSLNGKGYVGQGYAAANTSTITYLRDTWEYNPASNTWTQKADMGVSGRYGAFCFVIGNFAYAGAGFASNSPLYRYDCWRYNPVANTWNQIANLPSTEGRYGASAFSIGSRGFVACGFKSANPAAQKDLWQYDTLTNQWTARAALPLAAQARGWACGFALNGKGYIAGGVDGGPSFYYNNCFEYDTTGNSWTQKASLPYSLSHSSSFVIGNSAYLAGGYKDAGVEGNPFIRFNPQSNTWTPMPAPLATARSRMCASVINGKMFIGPGIYGDYNYYNVTTFPSVFRRDTWLYDPVSETWSQEDSFPVMRANASSFTIDSNVYVVGGVNASNTPQTDVWSLNPLSGTWTQRASFTGPARMAGTGLSIGNRGYYGFGVANTSNFYNDWYEYLASSNTWVARAVPGALQGRFQLGSFAINGRGYVVGGITLGTEPARCYEYNPANDSWTFKADLNVNTRNAGAAFSIGSKGYYACGYIQYGYLDTASFKKELYEFDPVANTWTQKASLPVPAGREGCVGAGMNGYGYVCGGMEVSQAPNGTDELFTYKSDLWRYTPDSIVAEIAGGITGYCAGSAIVVNYRTVGLTLNSGNVFTLQLSNASGSFSSPVSIGTLSSTAGSGMINGVIPSAQAAGTGYRIRIVSSNFADVGDDNGVNLTISRHTLTVSSFTPASGLPGDSITINGTNFIGASSVKFNAVPSGFRVLSASQIRAKVPPLAGTGKISVSTACANVLSANDFNVPDFTLNIRLFVEGLYNGNGVMIPTLYQEGISGDSTACDTLLFRLHEPLSPFAVLYSGSAVLKRNGDCSLSVPGGFFNGSCFLEVKTRNSLETWSKTPILLNNLQLFDLTQ